MTEKAIEDVLKRPKLESRAGRELQHVRNDKMRFRDIQRAKGLWT